MLAAFSLKTLSGFLYALAQAKIVLWARPIHLSVETLSREVHAKVNNPWKLRSHLRHKQRSEVNLNGWHIIQELLDNRLVCKVQSCVPCPFTMVKSVCYCSLGVVWVRPRPWSKVHLAACPGSVGQNRFSSWTHTWSEGGICQDLQPSSSLHTLNMHTVGAPSASRQPASWMTDTFTDNTCKFFRISTHLSNF